VTRDRPLPLPYLVDAVAGAHDERLALVGADA
jgi:hypothetical protein